MMLSVDGAAGEGGGQVLRSSLSLAAHLGASVRVENIRAGRGKPGLLRQHLTAVRAAAEVCGAEVSGASLGSRRVVFRPRRPRPGAYRFAVGTAGSATLVAQTVLPMLLEAPGPSVATFEGGTHNPMAPPFEFFAHVYLPRLRDVGFGVNVSLEHVGFYPAGGGCFTVTVDPSNTSLRSVDLTSPPRAPRLRALVLQSRLPAHVATRERAALCAGLGLAEDAVVIRTVSSPGPGNAVCVFIEDGDECLEVCAAFGQRGRRAEAVVADVVAQVQRFQRTGVRVGEHLADQLLLPLMRAGGRFCTGPLSSHARTNIELVRSFLGADAVAVAEKDGVSTVSLPAS